MDNSAPSSEVANLAARGQLIAAIKLYRSESGVGLAAAKAIVDGLPRNTAAGRAQTGPGSQTSNTSARAAAFLAATFLGLIGLAVTGVGLYRSHVASSWPAVEGEITRSRFVAGHTRSSDKIEVEYDFVADGQARHGTRISYALVWGPLYTRSVEARYPVGEKVQVHYDPSDSARSVLETRPPRLYWFVFASSLIALWWGVSRWVDEARQEREDRHRATLDRFGPRTAF